MIEFGLSKNERLCGEKRIEKMFLEGQKISSYPFRLVYLIHSNTDLDTKPFPVNIAVSVPKRNFKRAVKRNYIKRRMREAYRLNKHVLYASLNDLGIYIDLMVVFNATQIMSFFEIEKKLCIALNKLIAELRKR